MNPKRKNKIPKRSRYRSGPSLDLSIPGLVEVERHGEDYSIKSTEETSDDLGVSILDSGKHPLVMANHLDD